VAALTSVVEAAGRAAVLVAVVVGALVVLAVGFAQTRALYGGGDDGENRTNCPTCGARTPADGRRCEYCGERLDRADENA